MRITTTLIAIILSAGLTWSGCDKDSGGGSGGPGVDSVLPGEDSKVPGEDIKVPGEDTKVPGEDTKVPGEDTTVTPDTGCTPACEGKECGDDGCGGSCGACEDDETCDLGICVESPPGPICGDDVCEPPEDFGTCPEDCEEPVDPPTCTEDADCAGTPPCPAEAPKGCVCVPGPNGNACIPACDTAADCPDIEGVELICLPDGFCGPGTIEPDCGDGQCTPPETVESCPADCEDPVDPPLCTTDADCQGTPPCPPAQDAPKGCLCVVTPSGNACIPACDVDADCPDVPDVELVCLVEGYCGAGSDPPDCGDGQCTPPETAASCPVDCDDPVDPTGCATDASRARTEGPASPPARPLQTAPTSPMSCSSAPRTGSAPPRGEARTGTAPRTRTASGVLPVRPRRMRPWGASATPTPRGASASPPVRRTRTARRRRVSP